MIKLGITGGIGSGKSVVSRLFQAMNIPVYLTDDEAKRLTVKDGEIRCKLCDLLGEDIYHADGSLNKPLLANYIFGHPGHIEKVNSVIHPRVKSDFLRWVRAQREQSLVAMECAILYESGFDEVVDRVIAVSAPLDLRVRRAMERDHAQEEQIRRRITHQMSDAELAGRADFMVVNDGNTPLIPQIMRILHSMNIF